MMSPAIWASTGVSSLMNRSTGSSRIRPVTWPRSPPVAARCARVGTGLQLGCLLLAGAPDGGGLLRQSPRPGECSLDSDGCACRPHGTLDVVDPARHCAEHGME